MMDDLVEPPSETALSAAFAELAHLIITERSLGKQDIPGVLAYAARAVRHCDHAGITLVRGRGAPETIAATNEVGVRIDALQYEAGEGPALEQIEADDLVRIDDLIVDERWPGFTQLVVEQTSVRSMFSIRLLLRDGDHGALSFYAGQRDVFDDVDLAVAAVFSSYVSQTLERQAAERKVANLEAALEASRHIGAAMGILMARELLTFDQAFDRLRKASQRQHRKLRDVATDVVESGELPR